MGHKGGVLIPAACVPAEYTGTQETGCIGKSGQVVTWDSTATKFRRGTILLEAAPLYSSVAR